MPVPQRVMLGALNVAGPRCTSGYRPSCRSVGSEPVPIHRDARRTKQSPKRKRGFRLRPWNRPVCGMAKRSAAMAFAGRTPCPRLRLGHATRRQDPVLGHAGPKVRKALILHTPLLENLCYRARSGPVGIEGARDRGTEVGGEQACTCRIVGSDGATKRRSDKGLVGIGGDWRNLTTKTRRRGENVLIGSLR